MYNEIIAKYDNDFEWYKSGSFDHDQALAELAFGGLYISHEGIPYPGDYQPLPERVKALQDAIKKKDIHIIRPTVSMAEYLKHYTIKMALPGLKREDIFVIVSHHVLEVSGLYQTHLKEDEHSLDNTNKEECIWQEIFLPGNADPDFTSAEYRDGILTIRMAKTGYPTHDRIRNVIIY